MMRWKLSWSSQMSQTKLQWGKPDLTLALARFSCELAVVFVWILPNTFFVVRSHQHIWQSSETFFFCYLINSIADLESAPGLFLSDREVRQWVALQPSYISEYSTSCLMNLHPMYICLVSLVLYCCRKCSRKQRRWQRDTGSSFQLPLRTLY